MPVKVNAVLMRGVNDDQAPELLRWCLDRGYQLRFIEQMPLDAQHGCVDPRNPDRISYLGMTALSTVFCHFKIPKAVPHFKKP